MLSDKPLNSFDWFGHNLPTEVVRSFKLFGCELLRFRSLIRLTQHHFRLRCFRYILFVSVVFGCVFPLCLSPAIKRKEACTIKTKHEQGAGFDSCTLASVPVFFVVRLLRCYYFCKSASCFCSLAIFAAIFAAFAFSLAACFAAFSAAFSAFLMPAAALFARL